jgi:hypothetical protein
MLTFSSSSEEEYPDGNVGGRRWAFKTLLKKLSMWVKRGVK